MKNRKIKEYILQEAAYLECLKQFVYNKKEFAIEYKHYETAKAMDQALCIITPLLSQMNSDFIDLGFSKKPWAIINPKKNKFIEEYKTQFDTTQDLLKLAKIFEYKSPKQQTIQKIR